MSVASSGVSSLGLACRKGRAALAASSLNRGSARGERITASKNSRGDAAAAAATACCFSSVFRFGVPFFLPPDLEPSLFAIYLRLFQTTPITRLIRPLGRLLPLCESGFPGNPVPFIELRRLPCHLFVVLDLPANQPRQFV